MYFHTINQARDGECKENRQTIWIAEGKVMERLQEAIDSRNINTISELIQRVQTENVPKKIVDFAPPASVDTTTVSSVFLKSLKILINILFMNMKIRSGQFLGLRI